MKQKCSALAIVGFMVGRAPRARRMSAVSLRPERPFDTVAEGNALGSGSKMSVAL